MIGLFVSWDIFLLAFVFVRISKTFCFSNRGHGLYLATPSEIQKFTVCDEFWLVSFNLMIFLHLLTLLIVIICSQFMNEMIGELFLPIDMPEPPKESFFKGLFGGGARSLDREELCTLKMISNFDIVLILLFSFVSF